MTVEDFIEDLGDLGTELSNLDQAIYQWMQIKVQELKNAAPVDTGELRNSIKLTADRFSFQIRMNYYGVFQNYGVMGTKSSRIPVNVPEAGLSIGNTAIPEQRFGFKEDSNAWGVKYTGIRARAFFSMAELTNELANVIRENITE